MVIRVNQVSVLQEACQLRIQKKKINKGRLFSLPLQISIFLTVFHLQCPLLLPRPLPSLYITLLIAFSSCPHLQGGRIITLSLTVAITVHSAINVGKSILFLMTPHLWATSSVMPFNGFPLGYILCSLPPQRKVGYYFKSVPWASFLSWSLRKRRSESWERYFPAMFNCIK